MFLIYSSPLKLFCNLKKPLFYKRVYMFFRSLVTTFGHCSVVSSSSEMK